MAIREIPIKGMHCKACEIVITDNIHEVYPKLKVDVSLRSRSIRLEGKDLPNDSKIDELLKLDGYSIGEEKLKIISRDINSWAIILISIAVILSIIYISTITNFSVFKVLGISLSSSFSPIQSLLMGIVAGFSSCAAVSGSLVAGFSIKFGITHNKLSFIEKFIPQLLFNIGRFISFSLIGGILGLIGWTITISPILFGLLTVLSGMIMLILGLDLTTIFPKLSLNIGLPKSLALRVKSLSKSSIGLPMESLGLGFFSILLPCGFTITTIINSASSGSFIQGLSILGLFALGTSPGLLIIGGFFSILKPFSSSVVDNIYKVVGVIIIIFSLSTLTSGLSQLGIPIYSVFPTSTKTVSPFAKSFDIKYDGNKSVLIGQNITLNPGEDALIRIKALSNGYGCMSTLSLPILSEEPAHEMKEGKTITIPIVNAKKGDYQFKCAMGVPFKGVEVRVI